MDILTHDGKTFEQVVYSQKTIKGREFQNCRFVKCDFTNSNFSFNKFLDCRFEDCNLSMMKLTDSALCNADFKHCKILGVNFNECQDFLFAVSFVDCMADYSSFARKKMPKTKFLQTSLKEVSFVQTNLAGAVFKQADLAGAIFNNTDLSAADFTTAFNYTIDPDANTIKKAIFSKDGLEGLLTKHNIKVV